MIVKEVIQLNYNALPQSWHFANRPGQAWKRSFSWWGKERRSFTLTSLLAFNQIVNESSFTVALYGCACVAHTRHPSNNGCHAPTLPTTSSMLCLLQIWHLIMSVYANMVVYLQTCLLCCLLYCTCIPNIKKLKYRKVAGRSRAYFHTSRCKGKALMQNRLLCRPGLYAVFDRIKRMSEAPSM